MIVKLSGVDSHSRDLSPTTAASFANVAALTHRRAKGGRTRAVGLSINGFGNLVLAKKYPGIGPSLLRERDFTVLRPLEWTLGPE